MPVSLRRLVLRNCYSVRVSSLASIKRLLALEQLALHHLPKAGGDDALHLLALQLPAGLTSLEFSGSNNWKVGAVPLAQGDVVSVSPDLPAINALHRLLEPAHMWSPNTCVCGGLLPLQEERSRLTDAGTRAFAGALAAAEPAERPTLEHLCLNCHPAISAGTAAALTTAPFRHVSKLRLMFGGAL